MGIMNDDLCQTGLDLGLGVTTSSTAKISSSAAPQHQRMNEPSLTLSLFGKTFDPMKKVDLDYVNKVCSYEIQSVDVYRGQDSAASSLSNVSVKRERDTGSEEVETERISSEDDDGSNGRKKLRLTKAQSALLEESFKHHSTLNPKQKQDLARELKLRPRQVEVWFQNRRARTKLKQTEVDCEFLKKCCDTLSDENRRLQKELQELKAFKLAAQPLYMQLPAATLTMCPSCQSIGGAAAAETAVNTSFARSRFYNPFTNPSAAC